MVYEEIHPISDCTADISPTNQWTMQRSACETDKTDFTGTQEKNHA